MNQMIDSTQPANIPTTYNGQPATTITVFANEAAQVFDREGSNATAAQDAAAIKARTAKGFWSVAYVNQDVEASVTAALEAVGMGWTDAAEWPAPGCYEWCADPSGNIAAGRWKPATTPVAVQVAYPGPYDLSNPHPKFPARVAGYIDGPASQWPAEAWARFAILPDAPAPPPPPLVNLEEVPMHMFRNVPAGAPPGEGTVALLHAGRLIPVDDDNDRKAMQENGIGLSTVSDQFWQELNATFNKST